MSHQENPYPVDPTGPLTIGGIPDAELGPLFDALPADPNKHIERLRSAIADVDPQASCNFPSCFGLNSFTYE